MVNSNDKRLQDEWEQQLQRKRDQVEAARKAQQYPLGTQISDWPYGQQRYPGTTIAPDYTLRPDGNSISNLGITSAPLRVAPTIEVATDVARMRTACIVTVPGRKLRLEFPLDADTQLFAKRLSGMDLHQDRPNCSALEVLHMARDCGAIVPDEVIDHFSAEAMAEEIQR